MGNIHEQAKSTRGFLDKIIEYIPLYGGYIKRERRRDADRLERQYLAEHLGRFKGQLRDTSAVLTDAGRIEDLDLIDRLERKVEKIEKRILHADYGYAGFWDTVQISDEQLRRLYEFDLSMIEKVRKLDPAIEAIRSAATGDPASLRARIDAAAQTVEELDQVFSERERVVTG